MALCPAKIFIIQENGKIDTEEITSHLCFIVDVFLATAQTQENIAKFQKCWEADSEGDIFQCLKCHLRMRNQWSRLNVLALGGCLENLSV